jgi:hypothetical protein
MGKQGDGGGIRIPNLAIENALPQRRSISHSCSVYEYLQFNLAKATDVDRFYFLMAALQAPLTVLENLN